MRKLYHHPSGMGDADLKAWMTKCGSWETLYDVADSGLKQILKEILPLAPTELLETSGREESLREKIVDDFHEYHHDCQTRLFPMIWQDTRIPDHPVMRRRASRLLYRFFMAKERDVNYF